MVRSQIFALLLFSTLLTFALQPLGLPSLNLVEDQTNKQAARIILTNDTTICAGASIILNTVPALSYTWTPATYLDNSDTQNPTATPLDSIRYYVDALVISNNVISNGDFSSGNMGFVSGYDFANPNLTEGQYFVGTSPQSWNPSLSDCSDHTTGNGNMMLVNGAPTAGVEVWKEIVNVTPNTDYAFSTWIQALWPPNPAILSFSINGTDVGGPITASLPTCTWTQFYSTWNSGTNTTATISIVNKNTAVQGNDFALDDISFAPYQVVRDSITVKVEKPLVKTNNDTAVCAGSLVPVNTVGALAYVWSPSQGLSSTTVPDPIASPAATTKYLVTGTSARGCIAQDSFTVTVNPNPAISVSNDTLVCSNASIQLRASGGSAYTWSPITGLSDPMIANPVATASKNITYVVTSTDANSCVGIDSVKIALRPYPSFFASSDQTVCSGSVVTLTASGGNKYMWSPADSVSQPTASSTSTVPHTTITYSVLIEDSLCQYDTSIRTTVNVNPLPLLSIKKFNDIDCNTPAATLTASGAEQYIWTPTTGLDNSNAAQVIATVDKSTMYTVIGTTAFGCSATASVVVKVGKTGAPRFVVPNAFTPNNDDLNDCFGVKHWGDTKLKKFLIYNRWGQIVFETTNPSDCWDGTFKGQKQDSGSYAYVIQAITICGTVTRTGLLTLIR